MPLADWHAILAGDAVEVDAFARIDVEAGRAALAEILSGNGSVPPLDMAGASPSVADLIEARGKLLPEGELRLFVALKIAALGQGVSGARWEVVEALADLLDRNLLPAVPESADDRMALSHLFAALTGAGEIFDRGRLRPAGDALRQAGMRPFALNPRERASLLSGNELTLATTIGALFSAERILTGAIAGAGFLTRAGGHSMVALHPSVHRLNRQRGQAEVATALRMLLHEDAEPGGEAASGNGDSSVVFRIGAALDLLRHAGALLERAGNGVSEDRMVLWQSEEVVPGTQDMTAVAMAADFIAMALTTLAETAASASPEEAAAKAATLLATCREQAGAPALDPARIGRLRPLLTTVSEIVALQFLAAARMAAGGPAEEDDFAAVRRHIADAAPDLAEEGIGDEAVAAVADRVRSGVLADASGAALPAIAPKPREGAHR